jgi:hypothetical protein
MSDPQQNHPNPSGAGLAALIACIVQTLDESEPAFRSRFVKNLEDIYAQVRESPMFGIADLETLTLVRDLLKKF